MSEREAELLGELERVRDAARWVCGLWNLDPRAMNRMAMDTAVRVLAALCGPRGSHEWSWPDASSDQVTGMRRRPELDAAFGRLEEMASDTCGGCGEESPMLRWHGRAIWRDGVLSPWLCAKCVRQWEMRAAGKETNDADGK